MAFHDRDACTPDPGRQGDPRGRQHGDDRREQQHPSRDAVAAVGDPERMPRSLT
jgi:hypothetical protein